MNGNVTSEPWGNLLSVRPVKRVADRLKAGVSENDIVRELLEEFSVSRPKIDLALALAKTELALTKDITLSDVAIYLDIPFCPTKCAYCSFASVGPEQAKLYTEPYLSALYRELEMGGEMIQKLGFTVRSVYIGGGTPTTLMALELDNLLYKINQSFDLSGCFEFIVEAGRPDTITYDKLKVMKERGVTRISINPQTIHEKTLKRIGRKHTPESVFAAMELAKDFGFSQINMDVIAGLPGESCDDFQKTLEAVAAFSPENLTVHTMSIKKASRLRQEDYTATASDHRETAKMLDFAYAYLAEKGYEPYYLYRQKNMLAGMENTGFCLPGAACLYNIGMMEEIMPVFGFGVGAVTKLIRPGRLERVFNVKDLSEYLRRQDEMRERKLYAYEFYQNK
ncbi:MAG: coproporphyrinogen dehydrogenase HemZ [Clostridia bacterium]|nr:coproporphyrinogen dehydrogenase HemZ [Clostridia bacterium]